MIPRSTLKIACVVGLFTAFLRMQASSGVPDTHGLQLPALFTDHMVLQRACNVPVWGMAKPGTTVHVLIAGQTAATTAGNDGRWSVRLDPMKEGGPHELTIQGGDTIALHDVLIGDVWLASGQSNMEMPLAGWGEVLNFQKEIAAANYAQIRLFRVEKTIALRPQDKVKGIGWDRCSPATVPEFSSTAYFFGRMLHKELNVPIGLIESAWGGTIVETWTRAGALRTVPEFADEAGRREQQTDTMSLISARAEYMRQLDAWRQRIEAADEGQHSNPHWSVRDLDTHEWKTMVVPADWETTGLNIDGVVWFRKEIMLPASAAGKDLTLHAGKIDDIDSTWFNGVLVGGRDAWDKVRVYTIPGRLVQAGRNVIAIRVYDGGGGGGIWGDPADVKLILGKNDSISLANEWQFRVGMDSQVAGPRPIDPENPNQLSLLWNAMIHPLIPFAIKGVIWYQGESNDSRAHQYGTLFPLMITDWREQWDQGPFPFLFVQLAGFKDALPQPGPSDWAELRESQLKTLSLENTGMAVAIDIGDARDIHPKNKQEVGRRLALQALTVAYGKTIAASGPMYKSMRIEGDRVRLTFTHTEGGVILKPGTTNQGFAIAGADSLFHWAEVRAEGTDVLVTAKAVPHPVAVRYGWAANPVVTLFNRAGLPASPFRTDAWPGITDDRK